MISSLTSSLTFSFALSVQVILDLCYSQTHWLLLHIIDLAFAISFTCSLLPQIATWFVPLPHVSLHSNITSSKWQSKISPEVSECPLGDKSAPSRTLYCALFFFITLMLYYIIFYHQTSCYICLLLVIRVQALWQQDFLSLVAISPIPRAVPGTEFIMHRIDELFTIRFPELCREHLRSFLYSGRFLLL